MKLLWIWITLWSRSCEVFSFFFFFSDFYGGIKSGEKPDLLLVVGSFIHVMKHKQVH